MVDRKRKSAVQMMLIVGGLVGAAPAVHAAHTPAQRPGDTTVIRCNGKPRITCNGQPRITCNGQPRITCNGKPRITCNGRPQTGDKPKSRSFYCNMAPKTPPQ